MFCDFAGAKAVGVLLQKSERNRLELRYSQLRRCSKWLHVRYLSVHTAMALVPLYGESMRNCHLPAKLRVTWAI